MIESVLMRPRFERRWLDATLTGALAAVLSISAEVVSGNKNPLTARRPLGGSIVGGCGGTQLL